jgi:hypothetical protein
MATCTTVYGLAVVECSDRPCDVNDTLCEFANGVEEQLDALDAVVERTATTVPMVKLAMTVPRVITTNNDDAVVIHFDTVLVDTDNMFDSSASDDFIVFNTAGVYNFSYNFRATTTGGGNQTAVGGAVFLDLPPTGFGTSTRPTQDNRQNQTGQPMYQSGVGLFPAAAGAKAFLQLLLSVQGADTISFNYIDLTVNWLGDLS